MENSGIFWIAACITCTLACLITGVVGISVLVLNSTGSPGRFLLSNLLSKNKRLLGEFSPKINNRPWTVIRHPRVLVSKSDNLSVYFGCHCPILRM